MHRLILALLITATASLAAEALVLTGCDPTEDVTGLADLRIEGDRSAVAYVLLVIDGRPVRITAGLPLEHPWDTTTAADGTHHIQAFVYRDDGSIASEREWWLTTRNGADPTRRPPPIRPAGRVISPATIEALEAAFTARSDHLSGHAPTREAFGPVPPPVTAPAPPTHDRTSGSRPQRPAWLNPPAAPRASAAGGAGQPARAATTVPCGLVVRTAEKVTVSADAVLREGRVFTPARAMLESLGGRVEWSRGQVTAWVSDRKLVFRVGEKGALVDGARVNLRVAPVLDANRVYLAVRSAERLLGAKVKWDATGKTATVLYGVEE